MFKLTWRNLFARKIRLLMSTLAIVLGVGFLAGVLTFSGGLSKTFDGIIEGSTSDAQVQPEGANSWEQVGGGDTATISPKDVAALGKLPEVEAADGSIDSQTLFVLDKDGHLVGTGGAPTLTFNYTETKNLLGEPILALDEGRWPEADDEITLDALAAKNADYEVGDEVTLIPPGPGAGVPTGQGSSSGDVNPNTIQAKLVGIGGLNSNSGAAGSTLVVFSTEGAQKVFLDGKNVFTKVSLTAADGVTQDEVVKAAESVVPKGYEVVSGDDLAAENKDVIGEQLGFVSIFLGVFAVIAVIVGGFIIANTFSILVAQRVRELALLRALGASRKQVRRSVLLEALLLALIGSTIGLFLGLGLARALAALFGTFGLKINSEVLNLSPTTIAAAYAVGLLVTLVSAFLPARRAAKVAPVAAMREDLAMTEDSLRRRTIIGVVFLVIGAVLAVAGIVGAPGNDAAWIGAGAVIWVLTVAAIAAVLGRPVLELCRAVFGRVFGTTGRLAGDNAIRNPRRTGATAAALMIGLALVSAVGVLAASLSKSIDTLVDDQFTSDYLVQSPVFASYPTAIGDQMAKVDGVASISRQQSANVLFNDEDEPRFVVGADDTFNEMFELDMIEGKQSFEGDGALLSKTAADELDAGAGSTLSMHFPGEKTVEVKVVGVFENSEVAGAINVPLSVLEKGGQKRADASLAINAEEGADKAQVKEDLEAVIDGLPIVSVQDKEEFAEGIKAQVNQLLYMIYGLLALSIVIAVIGIINTLSLSVLERTREIGLLRAVGLSRRRLRRMITLESVTISVMGAVLGMALGLIIGILLQRSLGEDLQDLAVPFVSLAVFLVIAVLFGVLAAIVPAIRASRMKVLDAIATE